MRSPVNSGVRGAGETLLAKLTTVRRLPSVNTQMPLQGSTLRKGFCAQMAGIGLYPSVDSSVLRHVASTCELLLTVRTREWFLATVRAQMMQHRAPRAERSLTDRAYARLALTLFV